MSGNLASGYNLAGENFDSIVNNYLNAKSQQGAEATQAGAFLGSSVLKSIHSIYTKGQEFGKSIGKTSERLATLDKKAGEAVENIKTRVGNLVEGAKSDIQEAGENLLEKGKTILGETTERGAQALKGATTALHTEFENTARGLASHTEESLNNAITGTRRVLSQGLNEGRQAILKAEQLRTNAFNLDPEAEESFSSISKIKSGVSLQGVKNIGTDIANKSRSIISDTAEEATEAATKEAANLGEKLASRGVAAASETLGEATGVAAAGLEVLEPALIAADIGLGIYSLVKGIEPTHMPNLSLPTLQLMGGR